MPAAAPSSPRVVIYGRTSLDVSEGRSIDDQLAALRRWANATGRPIIAELRDDGVGASRHGGAKRRPAWQKAMDLISTGQVDELGVWEVSRSTRDRAVWAALIAACIDNHVMLAVDGKVHDPSDADDGFMLDLSAAVAVREASMTSKRTRRAVESRAAVGRPHGSLPYGYRRVLDPVSGRTIARVEDPAEAVVVREVIRRLLARESAESIARDLNQRGIRTRRGRAWRGTNLAKQFSSPGYAALRVHHGEVLADVKASWPALISITDYERLVAMFADPDRDRFRNTSVTRHLGTGLFRCGRPDCDGTMRLVVGRSVGRNDRYQCRTCFRVSRNQSDVDDLVTRLIVARLSRDDIFDLLADAGQDNAGKEAAAEVVMLKKKLREAREKVAAGELTLDDLAFFRKRWEKDLADAERRARPRWVPAALYELAGPDAADQWERAAIGTKRAVLDALFVVTILPAGAGHWKFDPHLIKVEWRG